MLCAVGTHGQVLALGGRPDVEVQTVLILLGEVAVGDGLGTSRAVRDSLESGLGVGKTLRRTPSNQSSACRTGDGGAEHHNTPDLPVVSARGRSKWNTQEDRVAMLVPEPLNRALWNNSAGHLRPTRNTNSGRRSRNQARGSQS